MNILVRWGTLAAAVGFACFCGGCGADDGVERFDVSGTVTAGGQPVATGQIVFQPDAAAGNSGPPGFATITEGKFDTKENGKGTIGGPHVARVEGRNPADRGNEIQITWEEKVTLPQETTVKDFNIPAEATKTAAAVTEAP